MIIFDYGHTLLSEPDLNFLRGEEELFKYVKSNKNNLTPKEVCDFSSKLYEKIGTVRELGYELHEWQFLKFVYEYLQIELTISYQEAEKVLWDNTSSGALMINIEKLLDYLCINNIRSGVISNIGWSGDALKERINRLLPSNNFEFIIASSDYMIRKPNPMLFQLALNKSGLIAEDVWYCGDSVLNDVEGCASVGMFPVWYQCNVTENPWMGREAGITPKCDHLHIHNWDELVDILDEL
jgi:putative hydrolase of the HAD superfamily